MVGGIADWFAVTALFRHPLGLPIPHTAIIPRNKDRIGDTLASSCKRQFPHPGGGRAADAAARRRRRARALPGQPPAATGGCAPAARGCSPTSWRRSTRNGSAAWSRARSPQRIRSVEIAPLLGQTLEAAITATAMCRWSMSIVTWAGRTLDANEDLIRDMVHQRAGWFLRIVGLDEKLADAIVDGLSKLTIDMAVDPDHPIRRKAEEGLADLAAQSAAGSRDCARRSRRGRATWSTMRRSRPGSTASGRRPAPACSARARSRAALAGRFGEALRQLGETLQARAAAQGGDQPVRPPRHGRHRRLLWRRHRHAGLGDGPLLGRGHGLRPAGRRGRPRPAIYPDQRHPGRRAGRARHPHDRGADMSRCRRAARDGGEFADATGHTPRVRTPGRGDYGRSGSRMRRPARRCSASARRASPPRPTEVRRTCAAVALGLEELRRQERPPKKAEASRGRAEGRTEARASATSGRRTSTRSSP